MAIEGTILDANAPIRGALKSTFEVETRCSSAMRVVHRINTIALSFS
jgi:hypothetical protein